MDTATMPQRRSAVYKNAPDAERDACGIGFVAHIEGQRTHSVLRMALDALCNHAHRGAIADDLKSGDGAGILAQIPYEFYQRELAHRGLPVPAASDLGVGQLFLHRTDAEDRQRARDVISAELSQLGLKVVGFRNVPVIEAVLGARAVATRPWVEQVVLRRTAQASQPGSAFERLLYRARRVVLRRARECGVRRLYIASLSSQTIVYKGLALADVLGRLYPDLHDPLFKTGLALFHQRYSTNTLPTWERAQPFHMICHNGEINTIQGNENWMRAREPQLSAPVWPQGVADLLPILDATTSDSGKFDQQLELLVHGGRDIRHALMMMVPEAWERMPEGDVTPERRAFYEYHSALLEPWDGPASITYTDGRIVGTIMDRNGLRPARFAVLENGLVVSGSEMGAVPYDEALVVRKGRLGPGEIFCVDTKLGTVMDDKEITRVISNRRPYGQWLAENLISLEAIVLKSRRLRRSRALRSRSGVRAENGRTGPAERPVRDETLVRRQIAFGFTSEEMVVVLRPLLSNGAEPVGAMGDDTPPAAVSKLPRPLFQYFKQRFAEVTNPPIDSLRETPAMSLRMLLGERANLLSERARATRLIELASPVLQSEHAYSLESLGLGSADFWLSSLPMTWQPQTEAGPGALTPGEQLRRAVRDLCRRAAELVRHGTRLLILTDEGVAEGTLPIPSLLATSAVHHHLIRQGLRMQASLIVRSGEPREVHHFAALLGYGANAVFPYLVYETIADLVAHDRHFEHASEEEIVGNFVAGVEKGLLKIMSKMGISTMDSYCGAQVFEAIGIGETLIDEVFLGTPSLVGGVGYDTLAEDVLVWHESAYPDPTLRRKARLTSWGLYKSRRGGELHEWSPKVVHLLQDAVTNDDDAQAWASFKELTAWQDTQVLSLRHLLDFTRRREPVPLHSVEPASEIVKRFSTAAMSHGALSVEAHKTLAVAMNTLGGKSNSGEGGEDPERYEDLSVSKIKQIASGRFGVTPDYLMHAEELQIKMAQGSKPGEGGQLPGHKVTAKIAELRYATPGVALISPPPHHDIYSIEDLAQLIFDLKTANPDAQVSVKLVAEMGVGTIAAGVVKGFADIVHIAGASGGTGASPLSSMKNAGLPWELGVAETHRALLDNGLRGQTVVRTDGGLSTGKDVVMAALLGADEYSFGTSAMIAEGCIMARVCHKDTCPVGVATQNPALRAKFSGTPEHVMRFMLFIAEEVREHLAAMGFTSLNELIGRPELLAQKITGREAGFMDLRPLLEPIETDAPRHYVGQRPWRANTHLGDLLVEQVTARLIADPGAFVSLTHPIHNTDRTVGARLACRLSSEFGMRGLEEEQVRITFVGSAGQSFGAFGIQGLHFTLIGEANDYLGKGLNGGEIVLRPHEQSKFVPQQNVIMGNTALYGATGGRIFVSGRAGERFGVRNSGATAVVEGVGEHGCEYMTGGTVVVLGETGRNFGAGMTGGEAFVYDVSGNFERRYNPELIRIRRLPNGSPEMRLKELIRAHVDKTGSQRGAQILMDWPVQRQAVWHVTPQEGVEAIEARNEGMRMFDKEAELQSDLPAESRTDREFSGFYTR